GAPARSPMPAPRPAPARRPRGGAVDSLRPWRHHPPGDRRVVSAGRRAPTCGDGIGQRRGDEAAGRGGPRRVGPLCRCPARGAACAGAGRARARPPAGAPARPRAAPPRQARDAGARCGTGRARRRERVMDPVAARRRSILWRARGANLFGAVMAFAYFRYLDPVTSAPEVTWAEIVFAAGVFIALTVTG